MSDGGDAGKESGRAGPSSSDPKSGNMRGGSAPMNGEGDRRPSISGSSSENDDECYIYKYKGSDSELPQLEQLNLDPELERASSPEMDFLEMDFDPEQSNGHDYSDECESCDTENVIGREELSVEPGDQDENENRDSGQEENINNNIPTLASLARDASRRLMEHCQNQMQENNHLTPNEPEDAASYSFFEPRSEGARPPFGQLSPCALVMIDNEPEVERNQFSSNCLQSGAAAALNTFVALEVKFDRIAVLRLFESPVKPDNYSLAEYLLWRSRKDITHHDIHKALKYVSQGKLVCRFFSTYPERKLNLCSWLLGWIEKGAVPIVTYNPQSFLPMEETLPDVWCHRMVRGVGPGEVHLTDPLQSMSESVLAKRLSSASVLLIKSEEVLSKWEPETDLTPLLNLQDISWKAINVLGQIVNVIREEMGGHKQTSGFIQIPTAVSSGVTLVMKSDNPNSSLLESAPELKLITESDEAPTGSSSSCSTSN